MQTDTSNQQHASGKRVSTGRKLAAVVACCLTVSACDSPESGTVDATAEVHSAVEAAAGKVDADRDRSVLGETSEAAMAQFSLVDRASAVLQPTANSSVSGEVVFKPDAGRENMLIEVTLRGLSPGGKHGFHIHAVGDCSAEDASSAGGHFNPYNVEHGGPDDPRHHLGDLGNVEADADGNVDTTLTSKRLGFSGPVSVLQKAVVVHAGKDDLETDPSGAAGARVACGVITQDKDVLSESGVDTASE